jgi:hypothetical protein
MRILVEGVSVFSFLSRLTGQNGQVFPERLRLYYADIYSLE